MFSTIGLLVTFSSIILLIILLAILVMKLLASGNSSITEYENEFYYFDPKTKKTERFASIDDPPLCNISVIVPAYNEENRLRNMLNEALEYLEDRSKSASFLYEILIVDDGSRDSTSEIGLEYSRKYGVEKVKVLTLQVNRGKGGAVRLGIMRARGKLVLFADADGATKFSDYEKLEKCMVNMTPDVQNIAEALGVVCGSRAHLEEASISERSYIRTLLMYGFHFLVWLFAVQGIKDTQCGFKLLTRRSAKILFRNLHIERWAFDVELLYIAQRLKIPIKEVAVNWTEIEGSKVTPVLSWIEMGRDLVLIWFRYAVNIWKLKVVI